MAGIPGINQATEGDDAMSEAERSGQSGAAEFFGDEGLRAATEAVKRNREFAVSIPGEKYLFVAPEDQAYDVLTATLTAMQNRGRERGHEPVTGGLIHPVPCPHCGRQP